MSKFAKMIVTYKGKKYEYLINTEVSDLQMDKAVESILRDYPPDVPIDWEDNPKITSRNTLQDLINTNNENKYN
jgi:hypothetical protein